MNPTADTKCLWCLYISFLQFYFTIIYHFFIQNGLILAINILSAIVLINAEKLFVLLHYHSKFFVSNFLKYFHSFYKHSVW